MYKDANKMTIEEKDRYIIAGANVITSDEKQQKGVIVGKGFNMRDGEFITIEWEQGHRSNSYVPALYGRNDYAVEMGV